MDTMNGETEINHLGAVTAAADDDTTTDENDIGKGEEEEDAETSSETEGANHPSENGALDISSPLSGERSITATAASDSSPEKSPKIRIKLKLPKISASGLPPHRKSPVPFSNETSTQPKKILPLSSNKKPKIAPAASPRSRSSSPVPPDAKAASDKPKSRIRSLKLPLKKQPKASVGETVEAVAVNSDEDDDEAGVAVAAVATEVSSSAATAPASATATTKTTPTVATATSAGKRRSGHPVRVRIPPLFSPGLRLGGSQSKQQDPRTTAAESFNQAMASAGYTPEARTQRPHRGSSTTRVVGDMFDCNVKLSLHFPPLVPPELWNTQLKKEGTNDGTAERDEKKSSNTEVEQQASPNELLVQKLGAAKRSNESEASTSERRMWKRPRPWNHEMYPVSLTIPYPETYLEGGLLKYAQQVQDREEAIVRKQEATTEAEIKAEPSQPPPKVEVPPIPELPAPPVLKDLSGFADECEDEHPLYPPRTNRDFVSHLDKQCFHITEGRYFGLWSNKIADPNFVGANAPGISGVNAAGGAGLATATAGSGSTAAALTQTSTFVVSNSKDEPSLPSAADSAPEAVAVVVSESASTSEKSKKSEKKKSTPKESKQKSASKPSKAPNASTSSLRKLMEKGGTVAAAIRDRIIRSSVHASRTGSHGQPFQVGDKVYPDVSKAFAAHAGVRPCQRCKNNKQGAYHCRLRRRHFDVDFDGGESAAELKPLFDMPIDELLVDDDDLDLSDQG